MLRICTSKCQCAPLMSNRSLTYEIKQMKELTKILELFLSNEYLQVNIQCLKSKILNEKVYVWLDIFLLDKLLFFYFTLEMKY